MIFKKSILTIATAALALGATGVLAKVSEQEAAKLKTTLTPFGAERAGNSEGTIPEWTGGLTKPPVGYKAGEPRPDPFADEQPLYEITAANYQQYADKLTEGQKALFEKYPGTFKMSVYPTHRTQAAPQWVYDNTYKNALQGELKEGGNGVNNVYGGIPFPIPKDPVEILWNHQGRWQGQALERDFSTLVVYSDGNIAAGAAKHFEDYPYYDPKGSAESFDGDLIHLVSFIGLPVRRKGEVILVRDPLNMLDNPRQAWQYIPGQRRVRRAPTIAYDTPQPNYNGQITYDDFTLYNGSPDRYDWKLIGKQEKLIPYNGYKSSGQYKVNTDEIMTPNHPNPEYVRWELHRVWVVEASLKEGKRHIYAKRRFYVDEDTWIVSATDKYDGRGELWRTHFANMISAYDLPGVVLNYDWSIDLNADLYTVAQWYRTPLTFGEGKGSEFYTPASVRQMSRR